jgi:hypothetical protein
MKIWNHSLVSPFVSYVYGRGWAGHKTLEAARNAARRDARTFARSSGGSAPQNFYGSIEEFPGKRSSRTSRVSDRDRVGPRMLDVVRYVEDHPGTSILSVAEHVGPHGSRQFGYRTVHRAIQKGLVRYERVRGRYKLYPVKTAGPMRGRDPRRVHNVKRSAVRKQHARSRST